MSYILDALKKSEQERGHGSVPGVQTVHSSSLNYHREKHTVWPWFLAAVLVINITALVYFMRNQAPAEPVTANENQVPAIETTSEPVRQATSVPAHAPITDSPQPATNTKPAQHPVIRQPDTTTQAATEQTGYIPSAISDFHELPLNVKQHIPAMTFSAHVYSSNPRQRSLVINGRFMEEGEQVNGELSLVEITADGAIFSFRGQRFRTSVLSGWN